MQLTSVDILVAWQSSHAISGCIYRHAYV